MSSVSSSSSTPDDTLLQERYGNLNLSAGIKKLQTSSSHFILVPEAEEHKHLRLVKVLWGKSTEYFLYDENCPIGSSENTFQAYRVDKDGSILQFPSYRVKKKRDISLSKLRNKYSKNLINPHFRIAYIPGTKESVSAFLSFEQIQDSTFRQRNLAHANFLKYMQGADTKLIRESQGVDVFEIEGNHFLIDYTQLAGDGGQGFVVRGYKLDAEGKIEPTIFAFKFYDFGGVGENIPKKALDTLKSEVQREIDVRNDMEEVAYTTDIIRFEMPSFVLDSNRSSLQRTTLTRHMKIVVYEYAKGDILFDCSDRIRNIPLKDRYQIIIGLLKKIKDYHEHNIIHSDITVSNVVINLDDLSIHIIDPGLAKKLPPGRFEVLYKYNEDMQLFVAPPECLEKMNWAFQTKKGRLSPKSDVYASVPSIARIFGCQDPFRNRHQVLNSVSRRKNIREVSVVSRLAAQKFFIDDALKNDPVPRYFKQLNREYLNRMQAYNYVDRPDSDEAVKFFETCQRFLYLYESVDASQADLDSCLTELVLLAYPVSKVEDAQKTGSFCESVAQYYQENLTFSDVALKECLPQAPVMSSKKYSFFSFSRSPQDSNNSPDSQRSQDSNNPQDLSYLDDLPNEFQIEF